MAEVLKYHIDGLDVLDRRLGELGRRTSGNFLRKSLRTGMNVVKKEARIRVPKKSRRLMKSIKVKVTLKPSGEAYAKLGFGRKEAYGVPVELGTSTAGAKPFLRPAMDTKHDEAVKAFADRMRDEIKAVTVTV